MGTFRSRREDGSIYSVGVSIQTVEFDGKTGILVWINRTAISNTKTPVGTYLADEQVEEKAASALCRDLEVVKAPHKGFALL